MNQILTIASASVKEHVRRRLVAFFAIGSVLIMFALLYLAKGSVGSQIYGSGQTAVLFVSRGFLQFFALLAALAVSMNNVGAAFSSGEALPFLARPVTRRQFVLGRLGASVAVVVGLIVLLAVESEIVQVVASGGMRLDILGDWATAGFHVSLIVVVTTLLSTVMSPPILVAIVAYFVNQFLGAIALMYAFVNTGRIHGGFVTIVRVLWYVSPKLISSPIQRSATVTRQFTVDNSPGLIVWAFAYVAGLVALTLVLAERKEI